MSGTHADTREIYEFLLVLSVARSTSTLFVLVGKYGRRQRRGRCCRPPGTILYAV